MDKRPPSLGHLLSMVVFALACLGLLLFLWLNFGGTVPLHPTAYRFTADFRSAAQLAEQADVRVSGVSVGKVVGLSRAGGATRATIELEAEHAPLPRDSRAMLRTKTLLGETYVGLAPGRGEPLPEGEALPARNVRSQVQFDEVLRAFDRPAQRSLRRWLTGSAVALEGRGRDVSDALGTLAPAAEQSTDVLAILDAQRSAVRRLVRDSGEVFGAIGQREGDVRTFVRSGDRLFAETARRRAALRETISELPPFLAQTRRTLRTAQATARDAAPVVRDLRPVAPLVRPALTDVGALSPDLESLFVRIDPVITLSRTALPAATDLVRAARPLVGRLLPLSRDLVPSVRYLGSQRDQIVASIANVASTLNATEPQPDGTRVPYLRAITYFSQEGFVGAPERHASNRRNPYLRNRGLDDLAKGGPIRTSDCDNLRNPQPVPPQDTPPPCVEQGTTAPEFGPGTFPRLQRDPP